ncbi:phosphoenolpyruvate synthase [Aurantiacibacter atlanticus]|nr:phosphoenolpyruvate synthase [Aurantiacibacter atlanticus]
MSNTHTVWFEDIGRGDVPLVGGKNASLGEMVAALSRRGIKVPGGFATTADAYRYYVSANGIEPEMRRWLEALDTGHASLQETGAAVRQAFLEGVFPSDLEASIIESYTKLSARNGQEALSVAVRSSATAEDLPDASFAGQQETFLNVTGQRALLDACRRCYASLFTDRAISYRQAQGFDHMDVALSIGVQQMVRSDLAGSGVMFSVDTETGFPDVVVISAAWGLGETVVQGAVDPDTYRVFKPFLGQEGKTPLVERSLGAKERKMIYATGGSVRTLTKRTTRRERETFVLSDAEVLELARCAKTIEDHYGRAMDMEWAKDGESDELFIVQARPETVQTQKEAGKLVSYRLKGKAEPILTGAAVGEAIANGEVCAIRDASQIDAFRDGTILVTGMTDPDWVPIMKRAAGIITDHGGTTSHAAIVSRELGVPAIVGTQTATRVLQDGQAITLSCAEGDRGAVYEGTLDYEATEVDLAGLPETTTDVMLNIASPAAAMRWWRLPAHGVGLARMEFVINNLVKVHPMALIEPHRVSDEGARQAIEDLTRGYDNPAEYFVDTLSLGLAKLAAPFHPQPVIVRLSDFKSNEYAHLLGGESFEPEEENPMIGWRGASRYHSESYRPGFELECRALKRLREEIGFDNVVIMVPFCRTLAEADRVLEVMEENGLKRGENGLQIYMMCEIPSNVFLAEEFARKFDGFSIGSNDLTQLILGIDRDSDILADQFDERDEAVKRAIAQAIAKAHDAGIKIGICGQAPSDHPEFAAFLVEQGIDSISLNPDSFVSTMKVVAEAEARAARTRAPAGVGPSS